MKNTLSLIAFALSSLLCLSQQPSNDTMHWSESRKLTWQDFKGKPSGKTEMLGHATILMNAKINKALKTKTVVEAVFDRKNSFCAEKERTAQMLKYYQTLFDLYESASRKLRKQFSETKFGLDPEKIFHEKYNAALKELDERVDLYMEETETGEQADAIDKWSKMVGMELKELNAFSKESGKK